MTNNIRWSKIKYIYDKAFLHRKNRNIAMYKIITLILLFISFTSQSTILNIKHEAPITLDKNFQTGDEGFQNLFEIGDMFNLTLDINLDSLVDSGPSDPSQSGYFRAFSDFNLQIATDDALISYQGPDLLYTWLFHFDNGTFDGQGYTLLYFDFPSWEWDADDIARQEIVESDGRRSYTLSTNIVGIIDLESDEWYKQESYRDDTYSQLTIIAGGQNSIATEGSLEINLVSAPTSSAIIATAFLGLFLRRRKLCAISNLKD